jgi:hypothetical protein
MPKLDSETRDKIKDLSKTDLQKIVLKFASQNKEVLDFIKVNYLDKEVGEQELFAETKDDLDLLMNKGYIGRSRELKAARMLGACSERITQFSKVTNNKKLEADLIVFVLDDTFNSGYASQSTCFTAYDNKLRLLVSRLLTIVTKKLHPDLKLDYRNKLNEFLQRLHGGSNHLDAVYVMPHEI